MFHKSNPERVKETIAVTCDANDLVKKRSDAQSDGQIVHRVMAEDGLGGDGTEGLPREDVLPWCRAPGARKFALISRADHE